MNTALIPISWPRAQFILSQLGYDLFARGKDGVSMTFSLKENVKRDGLSSPITIALPDLKGINGEPAYEKDYLVDLILMVTTGVEQGAIQAAIEASRHFDS